MYRRMIALGSGLSGFSSTGTQLIAPATGSSATAPSFTWVGFSSGGSAVGMYKGSGNLWGFTFGGTACQTFDTSGTAYSKGPHTFSGGTLTTPTITINNTAAPTVGANQVGIGSTTATTVGAAGGASALPATPLGYLIINVAGTAAKIPYYNN